MGLIIYKCTTLTSIIPYTFELMIEGKRTMFQLGGHTARL